MKRNRETDSFSIAFLDVISCGFGAIILLLMITDTSEPVALEVTDLNPADSIKELQAELFAMRGETAILNRDLNAKQEQLSAYKERIAILQRDLSQIRSSYVASVEDTDDTEAELGRLAMARQNLTAEMERLLGESFNRENNMIGGVPVDSEYIIFVIDTSGSMVNTSWNKMLEVIDDTLNVYPEVKGIQVMNDMGDYMFDSYRNEWIPDTPGRRQQILATLRTWTPYSNSSPVEGVTRAISNFYSPDKKISVYVLGDDFQPGGSITQVLQTVDRINREDENGNRLVRVHGIGFPNIFLYERRFQQSVYRFTNLMRELTQRNGGTFIGLNSSQ
ncbi:MAG: hypothetical protein WDZ76_13965 [Pseudohongiellaceae bacterium]